MTEKITPQNQDFPQWYQDVVIQAKLADYSPVRGCMVIRPNGYSIWEKIQQDLDARIKAQGVKNAYFPIFIPESFLKKEAQHVEGFAPQCAVVTYAGAKDLEEKLIVRPTSETIINSMFAKWIQSYRDLPLLINQWANVVRWEMRTRLFLRTTEFLWQEGHTCHSTSSEAEEFAQKMLLVYTQMAEELLAMPVIPGIKTQFERFAGALRTYTIEAMMQDKKALQAGTSHNLSTHFAQAFNTVFLDKDSKQKHVHQTSWGVSTRLIGGMIMTHSDDKGLVLPPALASTHVVIIPIIVNESTKSKVLTASENLEKLLIEEFKKSNSNIPISIYLDKDDDKQPGWKFHEYELLGIPIRLEIGPKDIDKNQVVLTRRDLGKKEFIPIKDLPNVILKNLESMQKDLLEKARKFRDQNTHEATSYQEFKKRLDSEGGFFVVPWAGDSADELKIKEETKATIRCLLLDKNFEPIKDQRPCIMTGKKENCVKAILARNY